MLPAVYEAHYHPYWTHGRALFFYLDNSPAEMNKRRRWASTLQVPTNEKTTEDLYVCGYYEVHPGNGSCVSIYFAR